MFSGPCAAVYRPKPYRWHTNAYIEHFGDGWAPADASSERRERPASNTMALNARHRMLDVTTAKTTRRSCGSEGEERELLKRTSRENSKENENVWWNRPDLRKVWRKLGVRDFGVVSSSWLCPRREEQHRRLGGEENSVAHIVSFLIEIQTSGDDQG